MLSLIIILKCIYLHKIIIGTWKIFSFTRKWGSLSSITTVVQVWTYCAAPFMITLLKYWFQALLCQECNVFLLIQGCNAAILTCRGCTIHTIYRREEMNTCVSLMFALHLFYFYVARNTIVNKIICNSNIPIYWIHVCRIMFKNNWCYVGTIKIPTAYITSSLYHIASITEQLSN